MVGWMDDEALHRTLTTGRCTYWSRSRQEYWVKGETSGHVQRVKSVALDCDGDTVLVKVDQAGGGLPHRRPHLLRRRAAAVPWWRPGELTPARVPGRPAARRGRRRGRAPRGPAGLGPGDHPRAAAAASRLGRGCAARTCCPRWGRSGWPRWPGRRAGHPAAGAPGRRPARGVRRRHHRGGRPAAHDRAAAGRRHAPGHLGDRWQHGERRGAWRPHRQQRGVRPRPVQPCAAGRLPVALGRAAGVPQA